MACPYRDLVPLSLIQPTVHKKYNEHFLGKIKLKASYNKNKQEKRLFNGKYIFPHNLPDVHFHSWIFIFTKWKKGVNIQRRNKIKTNKLRFLKSLKYNFL